MYIIFRSSSIHSFSSMFVNLSTGILPSRKYPQTTSWLRLTQLPRRYPGEKVHSDSVLLQPARKALRKSCAPHPKTGPVAPGETDRGGVDDSAGCTVVTLPIKKINKLKKEIPPASPRRVFFFSTFLRATKILSRHPQSTPSGGAAKNGAL